MSTLLSGINLPTAPAGQVPITDGQNWRAAVVKGDISLAIDGTTALAAQVVSDDKLAPMARGSLKVGSANNQASNLALGPIGSVILSNGADSTFTSLSGAVRNISAQGLVTLTGIVPFVNCTANRVVEAGTTFSNQGALANVNLTLPVPQEGAVLTFVVLAKKNLTAVVSNLNTHTITTLNGKATATGKALTSAMPGCVLQLMGTSPTSWVVLWQTGDWTLM
jgi:hypothetical protein